MNCQLLWDETLNILREETNSFTSRTVFSPIRLLKGDGNTFYLQCTDPFHRSFCLREKGRIERVLARLSDRDMQVCFLEAEDASSLAEIRLPESPAAAYSGLSQDRRAPEHNLELRLPRPSIENRSQTRSERTLPALVETGQPVPARQQGSPLNPQLCFDNFVVGKSNQFAYSVCRAVLRSEANNRRFNPLFLYGGSGLGKTHLLQAIGNHVRRHEPDKKVVYVQCEAFLNEFIASIQSKSFEPFRNKYRNCDYLLIDDIQFLQNKESTQEEFFHTFNTLFESGSQIVLTCDKPPQELNSMEERLTTRFRSGVLVDIQAPDYETRLAILQNMALQQGLEIQKEVLDYMARNICSNVRELNGALNKYAAYSCLDSQLSMQDIQQLLNDMIQPSHSQAISPDLILTAVCNYYNISRDELFSTKRSKHVAFPRQVAMYFLHSYLDMTFSQISQCLGRKDHTTAMHGCAKVRDIVQSKLSPEYEQIQALQLQLAL